MVFSLIQLDLFFLIFLFNSINSLKLYLYINLSWNLKICHLYQLVNFIMVDFLGQEISHKDNMVKSHSLE